MGFDWGAATGGLLGAVGSLIGADIEASGQAKANAQNIALSREQMEFQERMSGSAYQRAMADMKKAGLNPMLAMDKGGASSPSGSMASVENTKAPIAEGIKRSLSSAMDAMRFDQEKKNSESQRKLNSANEETQETQRELNTSSAQSHARTAELKEKEKEVREQELKNLKHQEKSIKAEADYNEKFNQFRTDDRYIKADAISKLVGQIVNPVSNALGVANDIGKAFSRKNKHSRTSGSREIEME